MLSTLPYVKHAQRLKKVESVRSGAAATVSAADLQRMTAVVAKPTPQPRPELTGTLWAEEIQKKAAAEEEKRFKIFEAEELKRAAFEKEMDSQAAEKKAVAISNANELIFLQDDRIKALHSAMMKSDALADLQLQVDFRKRKAALEELREAKIEGKRLQLDAEAKRKEEARIEAIERARKAQIAQLDQQTSDFQARYIERAKQDHLEGEVIKFRANEALLQEQLARTETLRIKKAEITAMTVENQKQAEVKRLLKEQEEAETRQAQREAAEIEERLRRRSEATKQIRDEKQKKRDEIVAQRTKELEEIRATQKEKLEREVKTFQTKSEEETKRIAADLKRRENEVYAHRRRAASQRVQAAQAVVTENAAFQKFWKEKNVALATREASEEAERRRLAANVAEFNKKLEEARLAEIRTGIESTFNEGELIRGVWETKDAKYRSYAEKALSEWEAGGKNVLPVLLELKKRKEMLA